MIVIPIIWTNLFFTSKDLFENFASLIHQTQRKLVALYNAGSKSLLILIQSYRQTFFNSSEQSSELCVRLFLYDIFHKLYVIRYVTDGRSLTPYNNLYTYLKYRLDFQLHKNPFGIWTPNVCRKCLRNFTQPLSRNSWYPWYSIKHD